MKNKYLLQKLSNAFIFTALLMSMTGCGQNAAINTQSLTQTATSSQEYTLPELTETTRDEMQLASTNFAFNLLQESLKNVPDGTNILISPISVEAALGMTANGAANQTLTEMQNVLVNGNSLDSYNPYMLDRINNSGQLKLADSIWIQEREDITVANDFINKNKTVYNADIFMAPFDDTTLNDINNWVSNKTNKKIDKILDNIDPDSYMYLINAASFEDEWLTEYKEDQIQEDSIFTNYKNEEQSVTMLNSTESTLLKNNNAKGFIKPYKNGDYGFFALLPNEDITLDEFTASFNGSDYLDLYKNREHTDVLVTFPEFTSEYETELSKHLTNLGMPSAFNAAADFSNMLEDKRELLYIGSVLHKTYIAVDRAGTKAAAATVVDMRVKNATLVSANEFLYFDRPFMYGIIDMNTGLPVFLGTVNTCE